MEENKQNRKPRKRPFKKSNAKRRINKADKLKNKTLEDLALPKDILEKLEKLNITNIENLLNKTERQLMRGRILVRQNIGMIKKALNDNGLRLATLPTKEKETPQDNRKDRRQRQEALTQTRGQERRPAVKETEANLKILHEKNRPTRDKVEYCDDIYVAFESNGKWGFKDKQGKVVVEAIYDSVFSYKEDLCCVELDEKFGYIDRNGELVVDTMYDCAMSFSEGLACVFRGEKCGYIDKFNNTKIDFKFDAGTYVINGNCRVRSEGKWGELTIDNPRDIRWII